MYYKFIYLILFLVFAGSLNVFAQKDKKLLNECQQQLDQLKADIDVLIRERDAIKETLDLFRAGENVTELEKTWTQLKDQIASLEKEKQILQNKYDERTKLAKEFREDIVRLTNNKNLVNDAFKSKNGLMIGDYHLVEITENNSLHITFSFAYTNAKRSIKFLTLFFNVYDEDKNLLTCNGSHENEISLLLEGIIKASGSTNEYKAMKRFVNDDASCLELTKIIVEYTDGSSQTFANQLEDMISIDFKPCYE